MGITKDSMSTHDGQSVNTMDGQTFIQGMETAEADTMVDQMAKTASTTNISVAQLGEGILTIGATAKSIKSGTQLRNIILSLQNPTNQASPKKMCRLCLKGL